MLRTEQRNEKSTHIDTMDIGQMLDLIHEENLRSVYAVMEAKQQIIRAVEAVVRSFEQGGRLIYVGAGTSGRIAVMDAAECPPTYGVDPTQVSAVIAGGTAVMTRAAEGEEDSYQQGRQDLLDRAVTPRDTVMGISASGGAAYVTGALEAAKAAGAFTVSLSSNHPCPISQVADIAIFTDTGPEVITGSTRMKAGNAQKMVLNMITTCAMIKTGKVYENLMINLKPTNQKLRRRMIFMVSDICGVDEAQAERLLTEHGFSVRDAITAFGR